MILLPARTRYVRDCACGYALDAHGRADNGAPICPASRPWTFSTLTLAEARAIQRSLAGNAAP